MDTTKNNNLSFADWIVQHSYAIITGLVLIAFNYGIMSIRVDSLNERVQINTERIDILQRNLDEVEDKFINSNATVIKSLETIEKDINRINNKLDYVDNDIQDFYKKYLLTRPEKGN